LECGAKRDAALESLSVETKKLKRLLNRLAICNGDYVLNFLLIAKIGLRLRLRKRPERVLPRSFESLCYSLWVSLGPTQAATKKNRVNLNRFSRQSPLYI
jgi:hypothetical protein